MAGAGGIFRLSNGYSVGSFASPLSCKFACEAELWAVLITVKHAVQFNIARIIQNRSCEVSWNLHKDWHQCLISMHSLQIYASHIFREGNIVAEKLSNLAVDLAGEAWWPTFPSKCFDLVRNDAMGLYSYRFS